MKTLKVYLSGSVKLVEEDFQDWRRKCLEFKPCGLYQGLNFVDPIAYFNYTNKLPKTDKQCIDLFTWQIEQCDLLLVNLDSSDISVGSAMEIEHAFCKNIPIIGFGKNPNTWYSWAKERASAIFDTLEAALDYITKSYANI